MTRGVKWKRNAGPGPKHPPIIRGSFKGRLNTNGKMFAACVVANGGNGIAAIKEIGYCPNGNHDTHQRMASDFRRNPLVFAEIERLEAQLQRKALAVIDKIRHRAEEIMESEAKDRVPAMRLFAEMTPGALVPKESTVNLKGPTLEQMVLEADKLQRERAAAEEAQPQEPAAEAETIDK